MVNDFFDGGEQSASVAGIAEEAVCLRAQFPAPGMSGAYRRLVEAEPNITQFLCERVLSAEMADGAIRAVCSRNTMTGARSRRFTCRFRRLADLTGST